MRMVIALVMALVALPAWAQSGKGATLTWVLPNQWVDGTALNPSTDLAEVRVYRNGVLAASVAGTATTAVVANLPYGPSDFTVTAVGRNGIESDVSNLVTKTVVDDRKPKPPSLLDVILAWIRSVFARFA